MVQFMHMKGGTLRERLMANVREVVFGLEDSLVSTLGTVSGIAVGSGETYIVVLAGVILVFVEAISMSAGSYLSSKSVTELYEERIRQDAVRVLSERVDDTQTLKDFFASKQFSKEDIKVAVAAIARERRLWLDEVKRGEFRFSPAVGGNPFFAGIVMGIFYILGGLLVVAPYLFLPLAWALPVAVVLTVLTLFGLGVWKASLTRVSKIRSGVEMLTVSLAAALLGIILGRLLAIGFGVTHW